MVPEGEGSRERRVGSGDSPRRVVLVKCLTCRSPLSDRDERHGLRTCERCAPGYVPEGSHYARLDLRPRDAFGRLPGRDLRGRFRKTLRGGSSS